MARAACLLDLEESGLASIAVVRLTLADIASSPEVARVFNLQGREVSFMHSTIELQ